MDSGDIRGRIHFVVEVPELVCYHMDVAGSLGVKVIEDHRVYQCGSEGSFQQVGPGYGFSYAGDLDNFFRHGRFYLGNAVLGFPDLFFVQVDIGVLEKPDHSLG